MAEQTVDEGEQEKPAKKRKPLKVPVDKPHWLTGRHYEFVEMDPTSPGIQHWDERLWRQA
ncbi:hypothetical protein ACFY04_30440 [Streptomyces sp. NPDC001549]|uniref:hypothetical protein n=1 Tax=Streptomyces sp. NPDC001549 TaxID=3364586 RepID=UPI0036ABCBD6